MTDAAACLAEASRLHTHCVYCGRRLIDVAEPGLYDTKTGSRETVIWRQCPRFPRWSIQSIWRGTHESFARDNPLMGRGWR